MTATHAQPELVNAARPRLLSVHRGGRVLLTCVGGIGDALIFSAWAELLKRTHAASALTLLSISAYPETIRELLAHNPFVDRVLMRRVAIDELRSALDAAPRAEVDDYDRFIREGLERNPYFRVALSDADEAWADRWLREAGLAGRPVVAVHLETAGLLLDKRFPERAALRWIRALHGLAPGQVLAFTRNPRLRTALPAELAVVGSSVPIRRSLALLRRAAGLVSADSGLKTAALAMKVPTLMLGPRRRWAHYVVRPYLEDSRNLFLDVPDLAALAAADPTDGGRGCAVRDWLRRTAGV